MVEVERRKRSSAWSREEKVKKRKNVKAVKGQNIGSKGRRETKVKSRAQLIVVKG
jgi:hypothetical protein